MAYLPTITILEALKTTLAALKDAEENTVFEYVAIYDAPDIEEALRDLSRQYEKRVCLILPGQESYQEESTLSRRIATFTLIMGDRDRKPGPVALVGDLSAGQQGIIRMKDTVVTALTGHTLALAGLQLRPGTGGPHLQYDGDQDDRPRRGWIQRFETPAGSIRLTRPD